MIFNKYKLFTKILNCIFVVCLFSTLSVNLVKADDFVSRGELAVILADKLGLKLSQYEGRFNDVPAQREDALSIEAVCSAGYIRCDAESFFPDENIDRVSLAIILKNVYEVELNITDIAPYGSFYGDYTYMTKEQRDAVDVVAMMDLMRGTKINVFGCYDMATDEDVDFAIARIEHHIWRNKKIRLSNAVANAVADGATYEQRWDLYCEVCNMISEPRGGIIQYDVDALELDSDITDMVGLKADNNLNRVGNAIAIRMDSESGFDKHITEVLVEEIPADYTALEGRILLPKEAFPVSGVYDIVIKSTIFPDITIKQIIYDKERVTLIPVVK